MNQRDFTRAIMEAYVSFMVDDLPDDMRKAIRFRFWHDLTPMAVDREMGWPWGTFEVVWESFVETRTDEEMGTLRAFWKEF